MNCYISMDSPNTAKRHVDKMMKGMGFRDLAVVEGKGKAATFFRKLFSMVHLWLKLKQGDVLVIQYPFKKFFVTQCKIAHMKGAKTVTLIHDLGTFRRRKLTAEQEIKRLSHTDVIIVHNESMNQWLVEHGCKRPLVNLDIFDYLSKEEPSSEPHHLSEKPTIVFAGGISRRKTSFIYELDSALDGCHFDLYGSGLEKDAEKEWKNIDYHGSIDSDEFIRTASADWGLVWDGDTTNGCSGIWGSYLRINNPHKASFYLRAGLPVIVWKESAMSPFITSNHLGIAVNSLSELPEKLKAISQAEYDEYKQAAMAIKEKLNEGYHFKKAFEKAVALMR
ncbi:MAG: galactofuranosyltransferase [Bacteroidales bacterium]|nr:galactofuranosyltransferase [Bacteroidales bacterium]